MHADHVIVLNNIIANSFTGIKAMHACRSVIITGNVVHSTDKLRYKLYPAARTRRAARISQTTSSIAE